MSDIQRPESSIYDERALRLQLDQAVPAVDTACDNALRVIARRNSLEERLARAEQLRAEDNPPDRVKEARAEISTLLGLLRCVPIPDTEIINRLYVALDRLDRAIDGESYIVQYTRLAEKEEGFNFTPPPDSCLPPDVSKT